MKLRIIDPTSHWIVPRIVTVILVILLVVIAVQRMISCKKTGTSLVSLKNYRFFMPGWDKVKLLGSVLTFIAYIYLMKFLIFPPASIISIFLLNILFDDERTKKNMITSDVISAGSSISIWLVFGVLLRITLPQKEVSIISEIVNTIMSFLGVVIGIVFGALPGMTATMAIAVFLPLAYSLGLGQALYLPLGLYVGSISNGLVPVILINIPGTPFSVTTNFDGHPMAAGRGSERALKIGITVSLIGGLISLLTLSFSTPPLVELAIKFSAVGKFLIIVFAMTVITTLSKGFMTKGVFTDSLGMLVALIDRSFDNQQLYVVPSFLTMELGSGFQLLPILIGLLTLSQILLKAEMGMKRNPKVEDSIKNGGREFSFSDLKGQGISMIRSSATGTFMGILPGTSGSAASLLSYSQAKNFSKYPNGFEKGCVGGLVASEAANNALTDGALIPLLSLGILGDNTTAAPVGASLLRGIQVGPLSTTQNPDLWKDILLGLVVCDIIMFVIMFYLIKYIAGVINIPKSRLYPVMVLICTVGSYVIHNGNMFDVWIPLIFEIVGFVFSEIGIPSAPFLTGSVLGDGFGKYFIDMLKSSEGSFAASFNKPVGSMIWVLTLISLVYAYSDNKRNKELEAQKIELQNKT